MPVVGNHPKRVQNIAPRISKIGLVAVLTYERPGLLTQTIESLLKTGTFNIRIYDDRSQSPEKRDELLSLQDRYGFSIYYLPFHSPGESWLEAIKLINSDDIPQRDGVVLVEDDLLFRKDWDKTLLSMADGAYFQGFNVGMCSVFRHNPTTPSAPVTLNGIEAYRSVFHTFQCNLIHVDVLKKIDLLYLGKELGKSQHGVDTHLVGWLSHNGYTNFICAESWVAHMGVGESINGRIALGSIGINMDIDFLKEACMAYTKREVQS